MKRYIQLSKAHQSKLAAQQQLQGMLITGSKMMPMTPPKKRWISLQSCPGQLVDGMPRPVHLRTDK
uniref:Uncharacterized protein n=1 Tax=Romanomermis culicivorax TaxID=13658 RepID=A0A915K9T5_ROMCU